MKNKKNLFDYHIHNSKDVDKFIKKPLVDVIITSPPYWNLKNYDALGQIGYGQKYDDYIRDMVGIFKNCRNILKPTGSMWVIVDSFKKGNNIKLLPFELASKLQENGLFYLQDIIIWQKDKTLPWSAKGKLRNIFEYILFFTKDKANFTYRVDNLREIELKKWWLKYPERYNPNGKIPSRVWNIPIPVQGSWGKSLIRHFCPLPPLLIEKILHLTTDARDVVLDPFAGSGTVLAQSSVMKRKAIGFDINKSYKKMYHDVTLPFFKQVWTHRQKELLQINGKKKTLKETIIKLRQLKFPVLLMRKIRAATNSMLVKEIEAIIVIGHTKKMHAKYYIILRNLNKRKQVLNKFNELKNAGKLKKFGLKSFFFIENISSIKTKLKLSSHYYVYENGVTNIFKDKIQLKELKDYLAKVNKNKFQVYILSNLRVNKKLPVI